MFLRDVLQKFLNEYEWDDKIEHDESDDTYFIVTMFPIDEQGYMLRIETDEKNATIRLSLRSPIRIPKTRLVEGGAVTNFLNTRMSAGSLQMTEDGAIYFRWMLDVEGTKASVPQINNMIGAAVGAFDTLRINAIGAAAFSKQTVFEIIEEHKKAIEQLHQQSEPSDIPSSL